MLSRPADKRPSPRRLARLATILFFDGFRAAPGWMALVTAMLVLGSVAGTCYPLGYKLLADGALAGNSGELVEGVAVVASCSAWPGCLSASARPRRWRCPTGSPSTAPGG